MEMCNDELDVMNWMKRRQEAEGGPYLRNPSVTGQI